MALAKSIKRDPFGSVDTRLIVTDPSVNDFYSSSVPFTGLLDAATQGLTNTMKRETSPTQEYRILELRNSFNGFNSSQECPRLEIDVAVDNYHLLDGLTRPWEPQNTPAPNSARENTRSSSQCIPKNLQGHPISQDFKFDCFQDSPQRILFSDLGDRSEPFNSPKLCPLLDNHQKWFRTSDTKPRNNRLANNGSSPQRAGEPNAGTHCVRFSPSPSISPRRTTRRPMPSIERERDYVSLYRHKQQSQKWKIARRPVSRKGPSSSPASKAQGLNNPKSEELDICDQMISGLPSLEPKRPPFPLQSSLGNDVAKVIAGKAAEASVACDSKITHTTQQNETFINVSFSLYRLRNAPALPGKVPKYAFEFRTIETDIMNLRKQNFPRFPDGFEHTIGPVAVEDLIFHTSFILTSLVVKLPLNVLSIATRHLTNTQAGNVMLYFARTLFSLLTHATVLLLSLLGVYFNCQWLQDTSPSD